MAQDTGASDTGEPDTAAPGPDTGIGTVVVDPPPPDLTADAVATTISEVLSVGIPEPLSARRAYIEALDHRDAFCPGGGDLSIIGEWEGCLAESGWRFAGYTEYAGETDRVVVDDFHLLADFRFHDPEGRMFIGGGDLDLALTTDGSDRSWTSQVSGTFSYGGAAGWMAPEGASAVLDTAGSWTGSTWSLSLNGALTDGAQDVHLDDLSASSDVCGGEASGTIGLRDSSGYWYRIELDCGCGDVSFEGSDTLGPACVDLTAILHDLAMEMRP